MPNSQTWFRLTRKLAEGGMGTVYLGEHVKTGQPVAVKLLRPDPKAADQDIEWLLAEVQATARLHHLNIIGILDHGTLPLAHDGFAAGSPYFAMEFVQGGSVSEHPPQDWLELRAMLNDCLHALAHSHARDLIHRDIKPANVLIRHAALGAQYVLTDFGIAHAAERQTRTFGMDQTASSHEDASGTPYYMAPEQFTGLWRNYGPWTDLYSLGIVAWELITGTPPFRGSNIVMVGLMHMNRPLPELVPRFPIPSAARAWLDKMTAKAPQDRFQCAADARDALMAIDDDFRSSRHVASWVAVDRRYRTSTVLGGGLGLLGMRHVPIEGRAAVRDRMWRNLQDAMGTQRVTLLRGDVGVGRSRLAEWLHHLGREVGAVESFKVSVGAEFGVAGGLVGLVNSIFRSHGMTGTALWERMEEWLTERGFDTFDARLLANFADMGTNGGGVSAEQTFSSLVELLACVARDRPVQIWFDDLDRGALECEFVKWVLDEPAMPLHVVATGASDFAGCEWLDRAEVDVHDVPPLSDHEVEDLLHKHVHLPPGIAARVIERAGGSPLFALQLMDHWMASGAIKSVDGRLVMEDHNEELPANINLLWSRRVSQVVRAMPDADLALRTLEVASVLGEVFERDALQDVCTELGVPFCDGLEDAMESHRLWVRNASGFAFCHRLLRESLLRSAKERTTFATTHAACARIIGRLYQAQHPQIALRIAHHLSEAGQWQAAIVAARHAATVARQSFDVRALLMCTASWERCLDGMQVPVTTSERVDLWTLRSYAYLLDAAPENRRHGFSLLDQAKAVLTETSRIKDRARYAARAAIAALYGYMPMTDAYTGILDVLASRIDDEVRFECEVAAARLAGANGDIQAMNDHATNAWGVASTPLETMQALQILARGQLELGQIDLAHEAIEKARNLALAANAVVAEARCLETAGFIADTQEDFETAARCHAEAVRLFTLATPRTSYPYVQREFLARALLAAGRFEESYEQLAKVRHAYELGKSGYNTHFHEALVAACLGLGRHAEAQRWLAPAIEFTGHRHHELHWRALAIGVNLASRTGQGAMESSLRHTLSMLVGHDEAERWIARTKEVGQ